MRRVLVREALVLTGDEAMTAWPRGDMLIEDGRITAIGRPRPRPLPMASTRSSTREAWC